LSRGDRSRPTRERTAEERERDREERERRRGQSRGESIAPPPTPSQEQPLEDEPPAPPSQPPFEPSLAAPLDESVQRPPFEPPRIESPEEPLLEPLEQAFPPEPGSAFEPVDPTPAEEPIETWLEDEPLVEASAEPAPPYDPPAMDPPPSVPPSSVDPSSEPPIGATPPGAPVSRPTAGMTLPPPPPLPPELGGSTGRAPRRRAPRSPLARVVAVLALLAVVAAVLLLAHSLRTSKPTKTVAAPVVVKVLIPEGKTRAQIAEIAAADHLKGSYAAASKKAPLLDPADYGAPHDTPDLEGFLFPATYDMDPGEPVSRLVEEQLIAFHENFGPQEISRARKLHVSPYQLLIVASMVEREAQVPTDRAKIAAVIYNRLRQGMPLGIDASIYYAVELKQKVSTYTHELTEADLHIDSPYNTRTHVGLPPTPISNPGDASIQAAANPAKVSYLYYVAAADGCGEQVFSNTLSEFEADDAAYQAAVKKNGGHPPSCKHK
jgi:UPF0755 protein